MTECERLATSTEAMLVVQLDPVHDRISRYFYSIEVLLRQRVRLEGHVAVGLSAVTWGRPGGNGIVADDNVKFLEDQMLRKVDEFIKDNLAVNPERKVYEQLKSS